MDPLATLQNCRSAAQSSGIFTPTGKNFAQSCENNFPEDFVADYKKFGKKLRGPTHGGIKHWYVREANWWSKLTARL